MSTAIEQGPANRRFVKPLAIANGLIMWASTDASDVATAKTLQWGTGAPNHEAAQGSVFIRLDAADSDTLFYRNTDGASTWETVVGQELTDLLAAANTWTGLQTFDAAVKFSDEAGSPAAEGVLQYNADHLELHDGTAARSLLMSDDIGATVQAYDAGLASLALLGTAADKLIYSTGVDTWAEAGLTAFARSILDDADEATFKATVNLEIGTDVQAYSATLGVLAANARDALVKATVACADAAGGATDALLTVQLTDLGGTNITTARQVLLQIGSVQYNDGPGPGDANISLLNVTAGAIVSTPVAGGLFLVQTDATGLFACTVRNTADTTRYFAAKSAVGGVSVAGEACAVVGSNSDSATWSA